MEVTNLSLAALLVLVLAVSIPLAQSGGNENKEVTKPPRPYNPLEDLILNQDNNGFKPGDSLSRVKRQYRRYPYPYPYPVPILIGGGFGLGPGFARGYGGGFGGRGFGGRGFGGRGFGGRGFGGRGGGIGGRGVGGGFGGGRGGGRG